MTLDTFDSPIQHNHNSFDPLPHLLLSFLFYVSLFYVFFSFFLYSILHPPLLELMSCHQWNKNTGGHIGHMTLYLMIVPGIYHTIKCAEHVQHLPSFQQHVCGIVCFSASSFVFLTERGFSREAASLKGTPSMSEENSPTGNFRGACRFQTPSS